tara:strand:- start:160 stop:837 length:678 start_codon:yes stop_codon:yes gene_type:complete
MLNNNKKSVISNYNQLLESVKEACVKYDRDISSINIVAVSKQQSIDKINALKSLGHISFGENRLDEASLKWNTVENSKLHFIGALQSKKIKDIVKIFDVIETLDTETAAKKISLLKKNNDKYPKLFVQINIGNEQQKRGVAPSDFSDFLNMCKKKYLLNITGAMCMPPLKEDPDPYFEKMLSICTKENIKTISMGMSNDFEKAIKYGATNIRVGSLIFGAREGTK